MTAFQVSWIDAEGKVQIKVVNDYALALTLLRGLPRWARIKSVYVPIPVEFPLKRKIVSTKVAIGC